MKRYILFIFVLMFTAPLFSQLDVLHYVPPLYGRTNVQNHYMILSTPSAGPVTVDVKDGQGTLIYTTVITDVAPDVQLLGTGYGAPGIINTAELNTVNPDDGFIVEATAPIYVNLRHVQNAQGLSLNSKGAGTGLGTRFRSGHIYSSGALPHVKAHEISVMATEDNTTVNFSDISAGVIFRNTPTTAGTSNDITVTLNAGESYTIAAWVNEPGATNNINGVNGTLVTSDKPIACNTGSWLSGAHGNLRDIGVDQIVPADLIGKEYIFVEGDGNANTERPLIVAEYDNTDIFVNGNAVPVATINAGDYFYLPQTAYSANDNIYIETSEDVFMYQSLSGASPAATSLNFIPALRCNGFKKVVIPSVNLVGQPTVSITARTFADVFVNGSATPLTGGQTVPGNGCWVTYKIPGGTGDFVVESDSIINVALLTLQGPRGSAGYFTGFAQFTQIDQGDTNSFVVCQDSASSYVTYSIEGPYSDVTADFHDPALNGQVTIDGFNADTLFFTYIGDPNTIGPDSLDLTACKLLECCGALPDTICEVSTLVFTNIADIQTGLGDSIVACADTSDIVLEDLLLGTYDPGGYWVDTDNSGALFGNEFDVSAVPPGVYHFTYYIDGGSICYDSTVVTVNVLGMATSTCCSIEPTFTLADPTCNGFSDGSILVADDWTTDFSLDGGTTTQATGSFNTLGANTYNVNLSFGPDCFFDTTIVLTEPDPLAATFTIDSVSCNGLCDGQILAHTTGGTAPYTFSLGGAPGQSDSLYTNLCAGPATVTITDTNNCQVVYPNIIEQPDVLTLTETNHIDETCSSANGETTLAASGGTTPYTYTINAGAPQANGTFSNLAAGSYTIEVTDANGCSNSIDIDIIDNPGPLPFVDVLNDVTCAFGLSGSVTIGVNSGTAPFNFSLDAGPQQASNTFNNIGAGNHTVSVTDANGCAEDIDFTITEPSVLTYSTTIQNATCNGECNGWIAIDASGSVPPYEYSDDNGLTFQTLDTLQNLCAGNVNVVVKDDNGCLANSQENITEPTPLTSSQGFIDPECHQTPTGEISFAPSGGTPGYQFSVDNGATFQGASPVTGLMAGVYDVIVEDNNGCQFTDQVTLTDPPPFNFIFVANNPSNCGSNDGSFEIAATSGTPPYTYSIDGGVTTQPTGFFPNLFSGLYMLYVTDDNGCADSVNSALSDNVMTGYIDGQINTTCYNSCDGGVLVNQNFGAAPFTYTLSTSGVSQVNNGGFFGLCAGTHYVTIEDAGLCVEIVQVEITQPDSVTFDNPTVDITCPDGADGEIDFTNLAGGDGGPFTYSVDGGTNYFGTTNFNGLTSGNYSVYAMDGNGCQGATTVDLIEPDPWDIDINANDLTCNGNNTGFIQVVADGATAPYEYTVSGTNTSGNFLALAAGAYPITITDDLGCTFDTSQTLNEPAVLAINNALTDPFCFGGSSGSITVTANGGTAPYLYSSDGGITFQSSDDLTNLSEGCYDVHVEDDNGCTVTVNECLNQPTEITWDITTNPETCGNDNGSISITANGGTPGYIYSNDGGNSYQPGNIFNGLDAINYNLSIQDANGCITDSSATITADPQPVIDNITFTNPLCFNGNDGTLTVTSSSGVGGHQYSITSAAGPYQGSNVFNGLGDGLYTVFVQDANGCVVQGQVQLTEPDQLVIDPTLTDLTCFQNTTGEIDLLVTGGAVPYQYSIDNGATLQGVGSFSGLSAGTYDLLVEDANGCQMTGAEALTEPNELQFSPFAVTDASCYSLCDGEVVATITGGTITTNYNYTWSGALSGSVGNTASNVCAGTYSLSVEDDNGCTIDTLNFVVNEPDEAIIDSVVVNGVLCNGDANGTIEIFSPNAGSYSIGLGFVANNQFTGLTSGSYMTYVQDVNGCTGDSLEVFVPTPQPLEAFVTPDEYICQGDSIFFSIVATGGTQPYGFDVNNGASNQAVIFEDVAVDTAYYALVTDANGCTVQSDTMFIDVAPPPVLLTANDTTVCEGDSIVLFSEADDLIDTYTYQWQSGETDPFIYPTIWGDTTFYVTVTDECGLTTDDSISVTLHPDPIVTLTPDITGGCPPFQINYTVGVNMADLSSDLVWSTDYGVIDSSNFNNLYISYADPGVGTIDVSFTSSNVCQVDTSFANIVTIYGVPVADFEFAPNPPTIWDTQVNIVNTSQDYDLNTWYFMGDTSFNTNEVIMVDDLPMDSAVTVCLIVENNFGCADTICKPIQLDNEDFMFVPNAIILDGYSGNGIFKPVTNYFHPDYYVMQIFNRWGELLFETNDLNHGWDGTYNNIPVQDGVYVWKIRAAPLDNEADLNVYFGHVTVLK